MPSRTPRWLLLAALLVGGLLSLPSATATAATPPPLPSPLASELFNLSTPGTTPGTSVNIGLEVRNVLSAPLVGASLQLGFYRYSSNGSAEALTPSDGWAPSFAGPNSFPDQIHGTLSGLSANLSLPALPVLGELSFEMPVSVPSSASPGLYLLRDRIILNTSAASYLLASRGYFPDPLWDKATLNPNGTPTLNLTMLGVSGVSPESGLYVGTAWAIPILTGILVLSLVIAAGVGVYVYRERRRTRQSRAGARGDEPANQAPSALGK